MKQTKSKYNLQPLIDAVKENKVTKSAILLALIGKGVLCNWGQVNGWLHEDETKRVEPRRKLTLDKLLEIQREVEKGEL